MIDLTTLSFFAEQEQFWDSVAETKEFPLPFQRDLFERYISKDSHVLDVGCGYGRTLQELHQAGFTHLRGVDFSQSMIDRGHRLHPYLTLSKMTHGKLPFDDKTFDAVILIAVLTCIAPDDEQRTLIAETQRVLKDQGILYINDFLLNNDQRNLKRYAQYEEVYGTYGVFRLPEGAVVRHHAKEHIINLTREFETLVFEPTVYTTMNGNRSNGFSYLGRKQ